MLRSFRKNEQAQEEEEVRQPTPLQDAVRSSSPRDKSLRDISYARKEVLCPWFPEADPQDKKAKTWRTWHSRRGVLLTFAAASSTAVLLINAAFAIQVRISYQSVDGTVVLYRGDCTTVKRLDALLHVFINALSTLLFSASNLCMQLLVAPTREEVDKAHQKHRWLDIGVPSWRNLRHISKRRFFLAIVLGLSSIPLHFV